MVSIKARNVTQAQTVCFNTPRWRLCKAMKQTTYETFLMFISHVINSVPMLKYQGRDFRKNMTGEGGSESLRMSFLEVVHDFRVSFLSLCIL